MTFKSESPGNRVPTSCTVAGPWDLNLNVALPLPTTPAFADDCPLLFLGAIPSKVTKKVSEVKVKKSVKLCSYAM